LKIFRNRFYRFLGCHFFPPLLARIKTNFLLIADLPSWHCSARPQPLSRPDAPGAFEARASGCRPGLPDESGCMQTCFEPSPSSVHLERSEFSFLNLLLLS